MPFNHYRVNCFWKEKRGIRFGFSEFQASASDVCPGYIRGSVVAANIQKYIYGTKLRLLCRHSLIVH